MRTIHSLLGSRLSFAVPIILGVIAVLGAVRPGVGVAEDRTSSETPVARSGLRAATPAGERGKGAELPPLGSPFGRSPADDDESARDPSGRLSRTEPVADQGASGTGTSVARARSPAAIVTPSLSLSVIPWERLLPPPLPLSGSSSPRAPPAAI